ncbi:MAG: DNA translocase FtsK [Verrucomicrobia bacterium]|nr:DNA translocase FtsK [Verrucomicrobiota bacterium]
MARKTESPESKNGFSDIIGIVLLGSAALLFFAQLSFDRYDLSILRNPPNHPAHNWIGLLGAWLAYATFFILGAAAYLLPPLLAVFGLAHLPGVLEFTGLEKILAAIEHLAARWKSHVAWSLGALFSLAGLLNLLNDGRHAHHFESWRNHLAAQSLGGWLGYTAYEYGFWMISAPGSLIVFLILGCISLIMLTDFQLGPWISGWWNGRREAVAEEDALATTEEKNLARKARELQRQARELEEQVAGEAPAKPSGLGADLKPVPEPTVRDLSYPQAKPGPPRARKTTLPSTPKTPVVGSDPAAAKSEPMFENGEVIPEREVVAATTADILGKPAEAPAPPDAPKPEEISAKKTDDAKPAEAKPEEPVITIAPISAAAVDVPPPAAPPKPRVAVPKRPKPITVAHTPMIGNYQIPPLDFLQHPDMTVKPTESKEELMANARLMQQTLQQFDIEVQLGDITKGPTITRYELHPEPGVKLEKITALSNNIAAALKAERINILAPVPGKNTVGVEVPNKVKTKVIMRDLLESDEWRNSKARIPLALGKDVYGHPIIADLGDMPHLLIAGSTGSGKSVCINAIIASLLYKFSPDQLRFVMIDPKVVELQQYNALPHLVVPVVNDPKKVILALRWVVNEMEKRYQIFARVGVRNIKSFNERPKNKPIPPVEPELPLLSRKEKVEPGADGFAVEVDEQIVVPREDDIIIPEKLSYIVVIIDELADLMLVAPADVEMAIARITQMARAAGIHCIVATQRPSVDVITGVIKSNIPARIAFQVAAAVDSRTILDNKGADKLLGKGDMLYLPPGSAKLIRAQGALITDQEIQSCVDYIAAQGKPSYELEIHKQLSKPANTFGSESGIDEDEEIIQDCIEVIRSEQKASVSLLQRRLKLGYGRAARIMDELENRNIVGPSKGAEPRDILIDLDGQGHDGGGQSAV